MRSSLGSCTNSRFNFDLKITCCHRQKPVKKIIKHKFSGRSILDEIVKSGSDIKQDETIKNFEICGTPVCFQKGKNNNPYRTRIYSNFHSLCIKKDASNNRKFDKARKARQNKGRENNCHRNSEQDRYYSSYRDKPKKIVNRRPINPIVIPRVPLELKTSLYPKSRTNFHNFKEPPLFSSTEQARRAIVHVLNCRDEKFLEDQIRPLVSGNLLNRYIQDVYDYLFTRHVETLSNLCTVELPPHRRSIHIHNKDYLYEGGPEQKSETADTLKNESSEDETQNSDEEELAEGIEHMSIDQPLVRMSPLSLT